MFKKLGLIIFCILFPIVVYLTTVSSIPGTYSKYTGNGVLVTINQSQLTKLRLRPQIINEQSESSRMLVGTVTTSKIIGQVFRASHDNINGIDLTMASNAGASLDDFESYADSAALQVVWVETDAADPAILETVIINGGAKAMELPGDATVLDTWVDTITSTDYTDYNFSLYLNQTNTYSQAKLEFFIGDGTNTKSISLITTGVSIWERFDLTENAFTEDAGVTDITAITKIGFRLTDTHPGSLFYIDDLSAIPPPGIVALKLWNMGAVLPVAGVNSIDDGTQYTKLGDLGITGLQEATVNVGLLGGQRMYHINNFVAGVALEMPLNELLIPDNYYLITINYVDTDVNVYGHDVSLAHFYNSGFSFEVADEATAVTATGANEDIQFVIYSTQNVYLVQYLQFFDAVPGPNSQTSVFVEDTNMEITDTIISGTRAQTPIILRMEKFYYIGKGYKFEQYYNPDFTDSVTSLSINMQYLYIPNGEHG